MATITLTNPTDGETGVGLIVSGKAWVTALFTIGDSSEPWGIGDCFGWESYLDGAFHGSSYGWKSGDQSEGLGGLDYYTTHTWRIDIIVIIDEEGGWEKTSSSTWSFTTGGPPANVRSAFMDAVGLTIVVAAADGIYISWSRGDAWVKRWPDGNSGTDWHEVICSNSGVYIIAVSSANAIYRTANGGTGWTEITPAGGDTFIVSDLAMSDNGQFVVIVGQNSTDSTKSCYVSVNYGATWTAKNPINVDVVWTHCAISNDGVTIAVSVPNYFEMSFDSGTTWQSQNVDAITENWGGLSISGDGSVGLVANLSNNNEFFIGAKTEISTETTWAEWDLTSAGRALLDDVDAAAQNTTLGFGLGDSPTLTGLTLSGLTATRLVASGSALASVADLTAWIAGTADHISVANDGDGTVTLNLDTNTRTLLGSFNGIFLEKINFTISESSGTVTGSLEKDGGGDLTQKFSDGYTTLGALAINLTGYVGSNAVPKQVFVYILQSAKTVIDASNSDWPETEHIRIANLLLKDATTTGNDGGALVNRNWNDFAVDPSGQGHITHIQDRIRQEPSQWNSGVALTLKASDGSALATGNSSTAIEIVTTEGTVYQLHKHTFPAFDMYTTGTDDVHIVNQPTDEGGAYETTAALVTDITHYDDGSASGVAIGGNKYFNLVVWGVQNRSGEASHVMINLPTSQYTTEAAAIADANGTSVYDIPAVFKGMGFLIARLTFRLIAGPQWTYIAQEDLRGQIPPISAGVGVTTSDHALLANLAFASAGHTGFQAQGDVLDDLNTLGVVGADSEFLIGTGAGALAWENASTARTSIGLGNVSNVATDDTAYNATSWNANTDATTKNAIRDKVETMDTAIGSNTTHRGLSSGNPHSVTPTELSLVIGTNTQAWDTGLDSLAGLGYVSPSMIKITAEDTYAIRTMAEVLSDIDAAASGHNHDATYQPLDDELTSLAGLSYAAASFVKMTAANTFVLRTLQQTSDDLEATIDHDNLLNFVGNKHIDWTADQGATNIHSGNYNNTQLSQEEVEDWAGALVAAGAGTHTGIAITYQDASGDIDFIVDHDAGINFDANEHIDHTGVTLTAGSGLAGGGTIAANRTFDLDINSLATITDVDTSADYYPIYDDSASANKKVLIPIRTESTNRTINFDNSMNTAEIQALIDAVGKFILPGVIIIFQFADGTYSLTTTLIFSGFFGGGQVHIQGNDSESITKHTTQAVILDGTGFSGNVVYVNNCALTVDAKWLKLMPNSAAGYNRGIRFVSVMTCNFRYGYVLGNSAGNGEGIGIALGFGVISESYVSNIKYGVAVTTGVMYCVNIDDTGTLPAYGLYATNGGQIGKRGITPAGSTANELTQYGGTIA